MFRNKVYRKSCNWICPPPVFKCNFLTKANEQETNNANSKLLIKTQIKREEQIVYLKDSRK
jgi:hypothetical protein